MITDNEDFATPTVDKRVSKPSVQLRSPFLNTFGSSSEDATKPIRKIMKIVIFGMRAYLFRLDLNTDLKAEGQKIFDYFINECLKGQNK